LEADAGCGGDAALISVVYDLGMNISNLTIAGFQKHISDRYEKVDRERGTPKTFLWLMEEIGELATALNGNDRANLEEEFADVIAWLCTLANINDVDLAGAIAKKYLGEKRPEGYK
jgi:NTP pyrophosphatase (non-canonical NTP hydrolase)